MAKEIIWTRRSIVSFNLIIEYLENEWDAKVTAAFVKRTYTIIDLLALYSKLVSIEESEKLIRGFVITKHNQLFYREIKKEIIILNFFDTRQNPQRKNVNEQKA